MRLLVAPTIWNFAWVSRRRRWEISSIVRNHTPAVNLTLAAAERAHILEVLREADWVVGGHRGAAVRLGLPRTTLLYKLHKLGIVPEEARQNSC